jgi:hypothetical protein
MTSVTRVALGLGAVAVLGSIWWVLSARSYDRPPVTHASVKLIPHTSSIVVPVALPLSDIQKKVNAAVPSTLYTMDENRDNCVEPQWAEACILPRPWGGCAQNVKTKVSPGIDCHLSGSVTLRGPISVGGSGTTLTLTVPVNVSVRAQGRGEIGKNFQQTAGADANLTANLNFDVNDNWEPKIDVSVTNHWDDPPHVWILGGKISFADKVDPKINDLIGDLKKRLPEMLADLKIRDKVQQQWIKGFEPIRVQSAPEIWLTFSPENVGYTGYKIQDGGLTAAFMLAGSVGTSLGSKPEPQTPSPLPKLARKLPVPGFEFSLALSADYTALVAQVKRELKIGETQEFDVSDAGKVNVTFKDVTINQTEGGALAVGLTLDAQPPHHVLATKGTIWLVSKFGVDNDKQIIFPTDLTVYSKTNNVPVDLLISLIGLAPINAALRKAVTYDFSKEKQKLLEQADSSLNRQLTPDVYLDGHLDDVKIDTVVAGDTALIAIVDAKGKLAIHSGSRPAKN